MESIDEGPEATFMNEESMLRPMILANILEVQDNSDDQSKSKDAYQIWDQYRGRKTGTPTNTIEDAEIDDDHQQEIILEEEESPVLPKVQIIVTREYVVLVRVFILLCCCCS
jgi:hypothetical protein